MGTLALLAGCGTFYSQAKGLCRSCLAFSAFRRDTSRKARSKMGPDNPGSSGYRYLGKADFPKKIIAVFKLSLIVPISTRRLLKKSS